MADEPTLPSAPGQPMPGVPQKIGRFEVRRQLGEGSFGAVYLAYDPDLDREVALKIPGGMTPASRAEFLKEARAAAKVMHPNVCQVFEVSKTDDNPPFIVSRFVGGGTLADYIRKANGQLPVADALKIAGKIASGLAAAHAKGIVHRDLKPGNILYDDEHDDFLITDFGLAKVMEDGSQSSGGAKGTPLYMSPEQFGDGETAGEVGPLSDVYALGVILYELLTGVTPFIGNPLALMLAHIQTQPKPPSARRREIVSSIDALCLKALTKIATERFPSVKEFGDALRNAPRSVALQLLAAPVTPKPAPTRKPGEQMSIVLPNGVKMPFAYCPPGEFLMGSSESEWERQDDELQHRVVISTGFWIAVSPVTQAQWQALMGNNPSNFVGEAHPVESVSWEDARSFCQVLQLQAPAAVCLPTEAEWEYVCRGGSTTPFYYGSELNGTQANCDGSYPYGTKSKGPYLKTTTPVGTYATSFPHPWGLWDLHGNVLEWCADWYEEKYYSRSPTNDPKCDDSKQKFRVARGGSWRNLAHICRAAYRVWGEQTDRANVTGFRPLCRDA